MCLLGTHIPQSAAMLANSGSTNPAPGVVKTA